MKRLLSATAALFAAATISAHAAEFKPAIVYDLGGKFDKSFNEGVYNGAEKFKAETGIEYRDFEIQNDSQREQAMRRFAQKGYNPILAPGFSQASAIEKISKEFPDTSFVILDSEVDHPNVKSIKFKEHEGSYLVGIMAAMASKSDKVGFIGGMDIPLIRAFACGYVQGVKSVTPNASVLENMVGTTGSAWNDPVRGGELAKSQIDNDADVIYAAAGGTGIGVIQAAADAGKMGIGVDSNQNGVSPGSVLTSMLKRVDIATYTAFLDAKNGTFKPGLQILGLAEGGVGYAMDEHNQNLVTADMKTAVDKASADIVAGKIAVHDYRSNNKCPM